VDEQLRAPLEQLGQRLRPVLGREPVLLLDRDPRPLAPLLPAALGVPLQPPFRCQQLLARRLPLLLRGDLHRTSFALTSSSLGRCDGGKLIGRPKASNSSGRLQSTTSTTRPCSTRSTAGASGRSRGLPGRAALPRTRRCIERAVARPGNRAKPGWSDRDRRALVRTAGVALRGSSRGPGAGVPEARLRRKLTAE